MPPEDVARLGHLKEAAQTATRFIAGRDRSDLDDDEMLRLALIVEDLPTLLAALTGVE